jgi:hypothetical protein
MSYRTLGLALAFVTAMPALAQAPQPAAPQVTPPAQQPAPVARSAAAGGSAVSAPDPEAAARLFRELDRNGDGYLTADELWSARGQEGNWAAVDRNRDGRISPSEFTVIRKP